MKRTQSIARMTASECQDLTSGFLFPAEVVTNGKIIDYPTDIERPRTRGDCEDMEGPCPWISCAAHLYLDVDPDNGSIKLNFPDVGPDELEKLPATCAYSVASSGKPGRGVALDELARAMNLSVDRAFQVVSEAMSKARANALAMGFDGGELFGIRVPDGARVKTRGDGRFVGDAANDVSEGRVR